MTALIQSDWLRLLFAVVCYAGAVFYGGLLSISGRARYGASWQLGVLYVCLFPTTAGSGLWLLQLAVLCLVSSSIGPEVVTRLLGALQDVANPESSGERQGLAPWKIALLAAPSALAAIWALTTFARILPTAGSDPKLLNEGLGPVIRIEMIFLALYFLVAWLLGVVRLRRVGRMRLYSMVERFHWMNGIGVIGMLFMAWVFGRYGPFSTPGELTIGLMLLSGLGPGLNELTSSYDAVTARVLNAHVLAALAAVIVFLVPVWLEAIGADPWLAWGTVLVLLAIVALALPARIEGWMLEWFFPHAAASRAGLTEALSQPLEAVDRARAGEALLERVAEALDVEGAALALPPSGPDPSSLSLRGHIDRAPLGETPDLLRLIAEVAPGDEPVWVESLAWRRQQRFLASGVILVCPLGAGTNGALLLGPRRGWLYDARTVDSLRAVGRQACLALENLALARSRAHADKLAALGEAAARIAHEIRNPLTAARSLIQLAEREPAVREVASPALGELDRIGTLVTDLLAFARRDDVPERAEVDLAEVCRDALAQVQPLVLSAHVAVESSLASAPVLGDRNRLVQVIANLCRNAVEALAESDGERRLWLRCASLDGHARADVSDSGPGVPAERVGGIFEPFHTSKSEGTGLGLAIARRIARAHGGDLTLENGDQRQSFRLTLPLHTRAA